MSAWHAVQEDSAQLHTLVTRGNECTHNEVPCMLLGSADWGMHGYVVAICNDTGHGPVIHEARWWLQGGGTQTVSS